jgi:phenylalanine-4-hydroxylase
MQRDLSSPSTPADDYISFEAVYPEMVDENGVAVWQASWRRRQEFLRDCADAIHPAYFRGLKALDLRPDRFPTLPEVNDVLASVGWRAAWVPGFIPSREFADLIRGRCFPVSAGVRALEFVDHAPSPDALHDIWGHLPFLFDETYSDYLLSITGAIVGTEQGPLEVQLYEARKELGRLSGMHASAPAVLEAHRRLNELEIVERNSPQLSTRLSRLFLWSIEFGLLGKPGDSVIASLRRAFVLTRTFSNNASKRMAARSPLISPDRSERGQAPIGRDATGKALASAAGRWGAAARNAGMPKRFRGRQPSVCSRMSVR